MKVMPRPVGDVAVDGFADELRCRVVVRITVWGSYAVRLRGYEYNWAYAQGWLGSSFGLHLGIGLSFSLKLVL